MDTMSEHTPMTSEDLAAIRERWLDVDSAKLDWNESETQLAICDAYCFPWDVTRAIPNWPSDIARLLEEIERLKAEHQSYLQEFDAIAEDRNKLLMDRNQARADLNELVDAAQFLFESFDPTLHPHDLADLRHRLSRHRSTTPQAGQEGGENGVL